MLGQLEADKIDDALAVAEMGARLERLGDEIGHDVPQQVVDFLRDMDQLIFAPVPVGNLDEFPLAAVRLDGQWLADVLPFTRTTTFNVLQESLNPNLAQMRNHQRAMIVLGAPDVGGAPLRGAVNHATAVKHMLEQFGFDATIAQNASRHEVASWIDGGSGIFHYVGHGIANEVFETLPLPTGEHFDATDAELYRGFRLPFVFLCACVAGRIRYGEGGHLIGLLTGLLDRGAPAGIAFTLPIPERRAYAIVSQFYRHAHRLPFAQAVAETQASLRLHVPAYAWLSMAAYGDPELALGAMAGTEPIHTLRTRAATWHSAVRNHSVLQTNVSADEVRQRLGEVPPRLRALFGEWLDTAFGEATYDPSWEKLDFQAAEATDLLDVERLTAHAATCAARLHTSGLHEWSSLVRIAPSTIRELLAQSGFLARLGLALVDTHLNGLGLSLMGRIQHLLDIEEGLEFAISQGEAQLWEIEDTSTYVRVLLEGNREILAQRKAHATRNPDIDARGIPKRHLRPVPGRIRPPARRPLSRRKGSNSPSLNRSIEEDDA
jgi:hypothetical protein